MLLRSMFSLRILYDAGDYSLDMYSWSLYINPSLGTSEREELNGIINVLYTAVFANGKPG